VISGHPAKFESDRVESQHRSHLSRSQRNSGVTPVDWPEARNYAALTIQLLSPHFLPRALSFSPSAAGAYGRPRRLFREASTGGATRIMIGAQGVHRGGTTTPEVELATVSPHYSLALLSRLSPALSPDLARRATTAEHDRADDPFAGWRPCRCRRRRRRRRRRCRRRRRRRRVVYGTTAPRCTLRDLSHLSSLRRCLCSALYLSPFLFPSLSRGLTLSLSLSQLTTLRYSEAQRLGARFELSRLWGADHYLDEPPGSLDKTWWGRSGRRANSPPPHHRVPTMVARMVDRQSRCLRRTPFVPIHDSMVTTPSSPRLGRLHR